MVFPKGGMNIEGTQQLVVWVDVSPFPTGVFAGSMLVFRYIQKPKMPGKQAVPIYIAVTR